MMIEFLGYDRKPILIRKSKILMAAEATNSTESDPILYLDLATEGAPLQIFIRETLSDFRSRFDGVTS